MKLASNAIENHLSRISRGSETRLLGLAVLVWRHAGPVRSRDSNVSRYEIGHGICTDTTIPLLNAVDARLVRRLEVSSQKASSPLAGLAGQSERAHKRLRFILDFNLMGNIRDFPRARNYGIWFGDQRRGLTLTRPEHALPTR